MKVAELESGGKYKGSGFSGYLIYLGKIFKRYNFWHNPQNEYMPVDILLTGKQVNKLKAVKDDGNRKSTLFG